MVHVRPGDAAAIFCTDWRRIVPSSVGTEVSSVGSEHPPWRFSVAVPPIVGGRKRVFSSFRPKSLMTRRCF